MSILLFILLQIVPSTIIEKEEIKLLIELKKEGKGIFIDSINYYRITTLDSFYFEEGSIAFYENFIYIKSKSIDYHYRSWFINPSITKYKDGFSVKNDYSSGVFIIQKYVIFFVGDVKYMFNIKPP